MHEEQCFNLCVFIGIFNVECIKLKLGTILEYASLQTMVCSFVKYNDVLENHKLVFFYHVHLNSLVMVESKCRYLKEIFI